MEIISESEEKTRRVAKDLARSLKRGDLICLYGGLGSGKTTFIQGLAKGLGIKKRILSPSFVFVREYPIKLGKFFHVDLFRLEEDIASDELGILENFGKKENVVAIEWADRYHKFLPKKRIDVRISYVGEEKRKIEIRRSG